MTLVKWRPMREVDEMRKDFEKLFDEFFDPLRSCGGP